MSSVNISLRQDAYHYLKSMKANNESFSDVVLKLKKQKKTTGKALAQFVRKQKTINVTPSQSIRASINKRIMQ